MIWSWRKAAVSIVLLGFMCWPVSAQAPPAIQFFMPDGSLPPGELRFTMVSEDGRVVDTFYTDSKGRFLITRAQELTVRTGYTVTATGDGRTFDTTTVSFRHFGDTVYYVTVFLNPLEAEPTRPAKTIDISELDATVPVEARKSYVEAMQALRAGNVESAVRELKRVIKVYPKYFRALNDLGVVYMNLGSLNEAAETLSRAVEVAPRALHARLNLGMVRIRQGSHKAAIELLANLHKENPHSVEVRLPLADALMAVDRLEEAEPHLRATVLFENQGKSYRAEAHYKLGLLLNRKQQFHEAIQHLEQAAKLLPDSARAHLQLGGALLQVGQLEDAEKELLAAYRLGGPQLGAAQFLLGQVYFIGKKYDLAMRAFERYLADVPQAPNANEVRAVVDRIKAALGKP